MRQKTINLAASQDDANISPHKQRRKWLTYQKVILVILVAFTVIAWVYTIASSSGGDGMTMDMGGSADSAMNQAMEDRLLKSTTGFIAPQFEMFVPMWIIMCIAMMLPTAIPMIYAYQAILHNKYKKSDRESAIATFLFVGGYLVFWAIFGVTCWVAGVLIDNLIGEWLGASSHMMLASGILFIIAGIYQIGPLKEACLRGCRHPVMFLLHNWHDGLTGALRIGLKHGAECVGCCWALMVVLFPLGIMNLLWMGLFTIIMYVEKNVRFGALLSKIIGWLVLIAGIVMTAGGILFL
ncbi:MAG: DUF2182 domain-containing protein [Christensenella sp.]